MTTEENNRSAILIRAATLQDCDQIHSLIEEFAEFEKYAMTATKEDLRRHLFDEPSLCQCVVATTTTTDADIPAAVLGYALFYRVYSTFVGSILYLEDIYVAARHRQRGVGRRLWQRVVQTGLDLGCGGLRFSVLDWNKQAINFYTGFGCKKLDEHLMYLTREGMEKVGEDL